MQLVNEVTVPMQQCYSFCSLLCAPLSVSLSPSSLTSMLAIYFSSLLEHAVRGHPHFSILAFSMFFRFSPIPFLQYDAPIGAALIVAFRLLEDFILSTIASYNFFFSRHCVLSTKRSGSGAFLIFALAPLGLRILFIVLACFSYLLILFCSIL